MDECRAGLIIGDFLTAPSTRSLSQSLQQKLQWGVRKYWRWNGDVRSACQFYSIDQLNEDQFSEWRRIQADLMHRRSSDCPSTRTNFSGGFFAIPIVCDGRSKGCPSDPALGTFELHEVLADKFGEGIREIVSKEVGAQISRLTVLDNSAALRLPIEYSPHVDKLGDLVDHIFRRESLEQAWDFGIVRFTPGRRDTVHIGVEPTCFADTNDRYGLKYCYEQLYEVHKLLTLIFRVSCVVGWRQGQLILPPARQASSTSDVLYLLIGRAPNDSKWKLQSFKWRDGSVGVIDLIAESDNGASRPIERYLLLAQSSAARLTSSLLARAEELGVVLTLEGKS